MKTMNRPLSQDLQPLALAIAACRRVWAERDDLLRLGVIPFIPLFFLFRLLESIQIAMMGEMQKGAAVDMTVLTDLIGQMSLASLGLIAVISIFSVNWIRQMTLGHDGVSGLGLHVTGRHFRFCVLMLAMVLVSFLASLIVSTVLTLVGFATLALFLSMLVMVVGYLALFTRLSPSWIGIALDARMPFSMSWQRTRGQGGRMVAALLIIAVPAFIAQSLLLSIFAAMGLLEAAPLAFSALSSFVSLAYMAVQITIFVLAYPRFVAETV
jgi:hypothetical protein